MRFQSRGLSRYICFAVFTILISTCLYTHVQAGVEISYATFLDPNNTVDPRVAAQTEMLKAFESANPDIRVKVVVDPNSVLAFRAGMMHADSPDVPTAMSSQMPQFAATGSIEPLEELIRRDRVDEKDWLLPLDSGKVFGRIYALWKDFRIPILMYRKHLLEEAKVTPPRTWDEVCAAGGRLTKGNVIGYAVPVGTSGAAGAGASSFGELFLTTLLSGRDGKYFADDHKTIGFTKESFVKTAQLIKDLFVKCKASTPVTLQFNYNQVHDGLRAGTIAMATFGVYRYQAIIRGGAGDDLAWAPPPGYTADDPQAVYGYQIYLNSFSKHKEEGWKFMKFMTSPAAQVLQAKGGEVVARASAYKDPFFTTPEARNQVAWAELTKKRGHTVSYTMIIDAFHQIVANAFERMILRDATPEDAYTEVVTKYNEAISSVK